MSENKREFVCCMCGSKRVIAVIGGKYYCFKCGSKIVQDHVLRYIDLLKERGLIVTEE